MPKKQKGHLDGKIEWKHNYCENMNNCPASLKHPHPINIQGNLQKLNKCPGKKLENLISAWCTYSNFYST